MEKYNLNEGNESLKKILLMMKYDSKKTLTENVKYVNEQSYNPDGTANFKKPTNPTTQPSKNKIKLIDLVNRVNNELNSTFNADENLILKDIKLLTSNKLFNNFLDLYKKTTNIDFGVHLYGSINPRQDKKEWDDLKKYLSSIKISLEDNYFSDPRKGKSSAVFKNLDSKTPSTSTKAEDTKQYIQCSGTYKIYCYNKSSIGKIQGCLGLKQDGYFGPKTQNALKLIGYNDGFTDNDIETICGKKNKTPEINNTNNFTTQSQLPPDSDIDPKDNV